MADVKTKLMAARLHLQNEKPYLTTALFNMHLVETRLVPTMAVDEYWRLYYNPNFLKDWKTKEISTLWYHEVLHLIRNHVKRALVHLDLQPAIWNVAADCEINDDLVAEELKVRGGWGKACLPKHFDLPEKKVVEWYYSRLLKEMEQQPKDNDLGQGDKGEGEGEGEGKVGDESKGGNGNQIGPKVERDENSDNARKRKGKYHVDEDVTEGSGVTSEAKEWEEGAPSDGKPQKSEDGEYRQAQEGESVSDTPGVDSGRAELLRQKTAEDILNHAKGRGNVPGHLQRIAEEIKKPRVNWRRELSAQIKQGVAAKRGNVDYSFAKPSRRQHGKAYVIPAMVTPEVNVAIIRDTSGSMTIKQIEQANGEVEGVCRAIGLKDVPVLDVDQIVHRIKKVSSGRQLKTARGGGGTNMGAGVEASGLLKPRPDMVIVLTDGITPWPTRKPGHMKVVIVLLRDNDSPFEDRWPTPDWARTIRVDPEALEEGYS